MEHRTLQYVLRQVCRSCHGTGLEQDRPPKKRPTYPRTKIYRFHRYSGPYNGIWSSVRGETLPGAQEGNGGGLHPSGILHEGEGQIPAAAGAAQEAEAVSSPQPNGYIHGEAQELPGVDGQGSTPCLSPILQHDVAICPCPECDHDRNWLPRFLAGLEDEEEEGSGPR